jgi:hypothetical protein
MNAKRTPTVPQTALATVTPTTPDETTPTKSCSPELPELPVSGNRKKRAKPLFDCHRYFQ